MGELQLKALAKQCLSIIDSSTIKDDEITMWINAGIADLKRQGIQVNTKSDSLVQGTIMMYVKANFGNVSLQEKQLAQQTYSLLCNNLGLSNEYMEVDSDA